MKKIALLTLLIMTVLGVAFLAFAEQPLPVISEEIGVISTPGGKSVPLVMALMVFAIEPILIYALFWFRREQRRSRRRRLRELELDPEEQERTDALDTLKSKISMLEKVGGDEVLGLKKKIQDIEQAIKESVVFDRNVIVQAADSESSIFIFAGCEERGDGFFGFYRCPMCQGQLEVSENDHSNTVFMGHVEKCPATHRSIGMA